MLELQTKFFTIDIMPWIPDEWPRVRPSTTTSRMADVSVGKREKNISLELMSILPKIYQKDEVVKTNLLRAAAEVDTSMVPAFSKLECNLLSINKTVEERDKSNFHRFSPHLNFPLSTELNLRLGLSCWIK